MGCVNLPWSPALNKRWGVLSEGYKVFSGKLFFMGYEVPKPACSIVTSSGRCWKPGNLSCPRIAELLCWIIMPNYYAEILCWIIMLNYYAELLCWIICQISPQPSNSLGPWGILGMELLIRSLCSTPVSQLVSEGKHYLYGSSWGRKVHPHVLNLGFHKWFDLSN